MAVAALTCRFTALCIKPVPARASCSLCPVLVCFGVCRWSGPHHSATWSFKLSPCGQEQGVETPAGEIWVRNLGKLCSAPAWVI